MIKSEQKYIRYSKLTFIFGFLSFLCNFGFIIYGIIYGACNIIVKNSYTFAIGAVAAVVMGIVALILKKHWLTPTVILIATAYFCINHFAIYFGIFAATIILDELIFRPIYKHCKNIKTINREIYQGVQEV